MRSFGVLIVFFCDGGFDVQVLVLAKEAAALFEVFLRALVDIGEAGPINLNRVFCQILATLSYVIGDFYDSISVFLVRRNDYDVLELA